MPRNSSKPPSQRQLRVGEEIRHVLAEIFERGDVHDPAVSGIPLTVSEVRLSYDLKNATVYVMRLGGGEMKEILKGLVKARSYLRHLIGARLATKFTPDLRFEVDPTYDYAAHIDDILHTPEVARDLEVRNRVSAEDGDEDEALDEDDSLDEGDVTSGANDAREEPTR
ncbi:30S ribosome-binding factor RbfA [Rhodospirillum sp. A1_3_36]|uniref:30S ribosome-binding factor RbfA n=1 Tax=Rhodospirillum sp. A1_3_36 TaxID=3391666 RepID=UPI0039A59ED9